MLVRESVPMSDTVPILELSDSDMPNFASILEETVLSSVEVWVS